MATYNVSKLIGTDFIASRKVKIYRSIYDTKPIKIINPGYSIGILDTWVTNKKTGNLYFAFKDGADRYYYVKYEANNPIVKSKSIKDQGVLTINEQKAKEETAALPKVEQFFKKYGLPTAAAVAALILIKNHL